MLFRSHGWYLKREREMKVIVGNAVLDMYVKCEKLDLARQVFDRLLVRDIVSWTVMISGLVNCRLPSEALELFNEMQTSGVKPDKVVLSTVLSACASLGALEPGRWGLLGNCHASVKPLRLRASLGL